MTWEEVSKWNKNNDLK